LRSSQECTAVKLRASISTLLFDWDGTIVDSAQLGLNAYQKAFAELNVTFSLEIYEASYSPNWYLTYEALGLPKDMWARADHLWRFHYDHDTPEIIEGAAETLVLMRAKGYRLGVVTSGNAERVRREANQLGLIDLFELFVCHEDITQRKPDPEGLQVALSRLKSQPAECAYVGDAPEDIQMGRAAGILTVGVRSNYPSNARMLSLSPDIYLESLTELADYFPGVSKPE
jgi:HAD superfamily hydrolase (TIGR01549 family)